MNTLLLRDIVKFSKYLTNYKATYLLKPRVFAKTDFVYPWYSILIYDRDRDNIIPSPKIPILHNVDDSIVFNMLDLIDDSIIFGDECKLITTNPTAIIKKHMKKTDTPYTIYIPGKPVRWKEHLARKYPLIVSYNLFTEAHRCKELLVSEMKKTIDKFYTKINLLYKIDKDKKYLNSIDDKTMDGLLKVKKNTYKKGVNAFFMYFKIPGYLLPFPVYLRYAEKELDTGLLKYLTSQERMELYLLFKIIYEAGRNNIYDIFNYIGLDTLEKTFLILEVDNKITITPLYFILSLIKELEIEPYLGIKTNKYKRELVLKLFYKHLLSIIESPTYTFTEISENINIAAGFDNDKGILDKLIKGVESGEIDINEKELEKELENLENEDIEDITENLEETLDVDPESGDILEELEDEISDIYKPDRKDSDLNKDLSDIEKGIEKIKHKNIKKKTKKAKDELEKLKNMTIEIDDKKIKLKDLLKIEKDEVILKEDEITLPDSSVVFEKEYLKDPINNFDKKYIKNLYHKDILRSIVSLARAGFIPKKIEVIKELEDSVLGEAETYQIEYIDLVGKTHKVKIRIPKIKEDGTYKISGNTYILRKQRSDVPIKKTSWNRVILSSGYGKIFIDKAPMKKYDAGYVLRKKLVKMSEEGKIKNLVAGFGLTDSVDFPIEYSLIARYNKSFTYGSYNFIFDYDNRKSIFIKLGYTEEELEKYEKDNKIFVGHKGKTPIFIDTNNQLYELHNKKLKPLNKTLFQLLSIEIKDLKVEYPMVKIYKKYIPVAFLLLYYLNLKGLEKALGVKIKISDKAMKEENIYNLRLADKVINIRYTNELQRNILHGFDEFKKELKNIPLETLLDNTSFIAFLYDLGYPINVITQIKLLGSLFVDPVTANILEDMNEPTTFTGLLIRASEMLLNDNYQHPSSLKGYLIRGYDRIPMLIYKNLISGVTNKTNEDNFSTGTFAVDPYTVWKTLNEDSASVLLDDTNPVIFVKQKEDTTYLGEGGRKKESMSKDTRVFHPDDIGVISEAVKDSGDVGITAYLSASPLLNSIRGDKKDKKDLKYVNILSTPAMLMPFTINDDSKRLNFINIQMGHLVPIEGSIVFPVRTGYDVVFPYKLNRKFIGYAEEDGVVINITKTEVTVKYKSGKKDKFPLSDWYAKEESFSTMRMELVPNVKKDDKVKKGDIITYCKQWFEPDMFDPKRVAFKQGVIVKTALQEIIETLEDSCVLSKKLSDKLKLRPVKTRSIILKKTDKIINPILIGEEVEPNTPLFTILGEVEGIEKDEFTKEELEVLQNFIRETPKAKYKGKVTGIKVFYNCEKKTVNKTIRKLIDIAESTVIDPSEGKKFNGRVDSSYSVKGIPLEEDQIEIKYYIEGEDIPTTGDKFVFGNQLKTTVGEVMNYEVKTENGEEIEAIFSSKSIIARIVTSSTYMGRLSTILRKLTKDAVNMYFNETKKGDK